MSERGSFVTQYIYCAKCWEAAKKVLLGRGKELCSVVVPQWDNSGTEMPIIAGKIGYSYPGEWQFIFDDDLCEQLSALVCHPVRIVFISDDGKEVVDFTASPKNKQENS